MKVQAVLTYALASLLAGLAFAAVQAVVLFDVAQQLEGSVLGVFVVALGLGTLLSMLLVAPIWAAARALIPYLRARQSAFLQPIVALSAFFAVGLIGAIFTLSTLKDFGITVGSPIYWQSLYALLETNSLSLLLAGLAWGAVFALRTPKKNQPMETAA